MEVNNAYITVVDSLSLVPAAKVLGESLKDSNSKFPLVVAISEDIFEKVSGEFKELGFLTESVPKIESKNKESELSDSVLGIFSLKDKYDKLVYLDCRTLIIKNIDDFLSYPNTSIIDFESPENRQYPVFIFEPRFHDIFVYQCLMDNMGLSLKELLNILWTTPLIDSKYRLPKEGFRIYEPYMKEDSEISVLLFDESKDIRPWNVSKGLINSFSEDNYIHKYLGIVSRLYPIDLKFESGNITSLFQTNSIERRWKSIIDF